MAGGRPSAFKPEYCDQALKLCLLGAKDKELADFFDVSEQTINAWKQVQPKFLEALKEGKEQADSNVANRLYLRALGYEHDEVYISNYQGNVTLTPIRKIYPPDPTSAIFWLKNRQPDKWRDRKDIEHSGKIQLVDFLKELDPPNAAR